MKKCISSLLTASLILGTIMLMTSCAYHNVMMADVITFSDDAQTSYNYENKFFNLVKKQSDPYVIYGSTTGFRKQRDAEASKATMNYNDYNALKKKIKNIPSGQLTAGLYALDLGLDRIKYVRTKILKRDKKTKYYIIYLTDGLDNTSLQVAKNNKQTYFASDNAKYLESINKKKKRVMGLGEKQQCFQIFPMAFVGNDMQIMKNSNGWSDDELKKRIEEELNMFAGASKGWNAPVPILAKDWKELQDKFEELFTTASYDFYIPKGYLNEEVKMTLKNSANDSVIVKGTYVKKMSNYYLENISIEGYDNTGRKLNTIKSTNGTVSTNEIPQILATNYDNKNALMSWFSIPGLNKDGKGYKVTSATQHHKKNGSWFYNSEYNSGEKTNANTYFMFIVDGSSSLGDQRKKEEDMLDQLLETIKNTFVKKQ